MPANFVKKRFFPAQSNNTTRDLFPALILYLFLPAVIFPLQILFPFPVFIEETVKLLTLHLTKWRIEPGKIYQPFLFGAVFGVSESMLHLSNAVQLGLFEPFLYRLLLTVPMHAVTMSMLGIGLSSKKWWVVGWIVAICVHYIFNVSVGYEKWFL